MDSFFIIFQLIVLIFSIVIHEYFHGASADILGDPTARNAGRLTLNPIKHLDFFGSFLLPITLFLTTGGKFVFGWAKPVPYNPYNLRNQRRDSALVGLSGPLANLTIAFIFGLLLRYLLKSNFLSSEFIYLYKLIDTIVVLNILLAVFNLIPIPPLDGSKLLFSILPLSLKNIEYFLEQYGILILFLFIFFGFHYIFPIIGLIYKLFTGQDFL